jgi:hypothetical protein
MNPTPWTPARKKPDTDTTVLIACPRSDEPVWLGFWDSADSTWRTVEGARVAVSHWQPLPEPPPKAAY